MIYEIPSGVVAEESVRIFVQFNRVESAVKGIVLKGVVHIIRNKNFPNLNPSVSHDGNRNFKIYTTSLVLSVHVLNDKKPMSRNSKCPNGRIRKN